MNEKEAVERLEELNWSYFDMSEYSSTPYLQAIETVLNLLENKDKESHFIQSELDIANAKIIKLNKMIDLMAEYINDIDVTEDLCEEVVCEEQNDCKECIKQYFERKV